MFGWRAKIGYISPSIFEMVAYDFYRVAPSGVGLIGVACMIDGWTTEAYRKGLEQLENCAKELGRRRCDFIVHAGVPLVVAQGSGFEKEIVKKLEVKSGSPSTTSIVAGMESLRALSAQRIGLINPYPPELNDMLVKFLTANGFDIRAVISLGADFTRIGEITVADIYQAAKKTVKESRGLEGLYFPCPQFPVLDVVEEIEKDFGVPAVAHLASELWLAFRTIGVHQTIRGFGRLLATG